ncbi:MAG: glycosyltransferase family 2 protein, partial [Bacteroidota bacterium]|nr:glycosyltransferase family 2 protein [Bacteroidota bacterium]
MRVSVIIVSYNVYPFLDNCLRSVQQAIKGIDCEIIVVDNASVDRTIPYLKEYFPQVKLIANQENVGFAKANNQGIDQSSGEFILLLNPDTIVSENTLKVCLNYMDQNVKAGAIGVKMIDGSGRFLPESKRGFPTLRASFMKMTGLYHLFPRSQYMNSYYQGQIDENETAEIDVLCGAFMFIRKSTLNASGYLDEDFFMYGEDIDLSYRIRQTGQSIVYLPTTSIIHYKGESTRKSSLNYIMTFYQAMLIFTNKHPEFSGQKFLIRIAIYLHGLIQFFKQTAVRWWPPMIDATLFAGSFVLVSKLWATYYFG